MGSGPLNEELCADHDGGHFVVHHALVDAVVVFAKLLQDQVAVLHSVTISG